MPAAGTVRVLRSSNVLESKICVRGVFQLTRSFLPAFCLPEMEIGEKGSELGASFQTNQLPGRLRNFLDFCRHLFQFAGLGNRLKKILQVQSGTAAALVLPAHYEAAMLATYAASEIHAQRLFQEPRPYYTTLTKRPEPSAPKTPKILPVVVKS